MQNISLVVENAILIRYYSYTPKARALIECIDGPAGRTADNTPNSDVLGVYHQTVPELTVWVWWQPGPPIWQRFRLDPDTDPKWRSQTIANTIYSSYYVSLDIQCVLYTVEWLSKVAEHQMAPTKHQIRWSRCMISSWLASADLRWSDKSLSPDSV